MKLAIVISHYPLGNRVGGAEVQCLNVANYFSSCGHDVTYYALKMKSTPTGDRGFKVVFNDSERFWRGLLILFARFWIMKPDVCYLRDFRHLFFVFLICKITKVPLVFNTTHIENCFPNKNIEYSKKFFKFIMVPLIKFKHRLNFSILKRINVVTVTKQHGEILSKFGVKSICIYNSIKDDHALTNDNDLMKQRQVVWVANIKVRKRPEIFIHLAHALRDVGYKFIMVGHFHNNCDYYKNLIRNEQRENKNFVFLGGRSPAQVETLLAKSSVLVSTCKPEGFPNVFIQAWYNKCPVVSLEYDPDFVISTYQLGLVVNSIDELVQKTAALLATPREIVSMGARARQYASEHHSVQINMSCFENYFKRIITNG